MAFPAQSVTPPALSSFQLYYQGATFGPGPFLIKKLKGIRGFGQMRSGDQPRARDHGEFIGLDLLPGRDVTMTLDVGPPYVSQAGPIETAMQALANVLLPQGTTEQPLFYSEDGVTTWARLCRPRMRDPELNVTYGYGLLEDDQIIWHATDPRWYTSPTSQTAINLGTPTGGFTFALGFPFTFGAISNPNAATLINTGNMDCKPIVTFNGPLTFPSIGNLSVPGAPFITYDVIMASGDKLVVDFDFHSATYYLAGSSVGFSVASTLAPASTWWAIMSAYGLNAVAGGKNVIRFTSSDAAPTAGTAQVQWASAAIL